MLACDASGEERFLGWSNHGANIAATGTPSNVALPKPKSIPFPTETPQELRFSTHALLPSPVPRIVISI